MLKAVRELIAIYFDKKVPRAAAQLAYYLTLSIFPMLICVNAMLGKMNLNETELLGYLHGVIPEAAYNIILDYINYISSNFSMTMLVAAITLLVTSSSAGFRAMLTVMAEIQEEHRYIGFWKMLFSVIFSLLFIVALYLSCIVIIAGNWLIVYITDYTGRVIFLSLWNWIRFVLLFVILFTIIYAMYKISSPRAKNPRQRVIGALAAALAMVVASIFFSWTITLSVKYPLIYGSLASMIIIMIWLFICGNILIMGNALNVVINRYLEGKSIKD